MNLPNNTTFSTFIQNLYEKLQEPLPGELAHKTMYPETRKFFATSPNENTRKSAVLILFYPDENTIFFPLIHRPPYDGTHGGQMAFPGGGMELSDESLIRTALREAQEEIGIKAIDVHVLGKLTEIYIAPSNYLVLPVVGYINYVPDFYPDPHEVARILSVRLETILDPNTLTTTTITARGFSFQVPCYKIEEQDVWGATALMIAELLCLIRKNEHISK